MQLRIVYGIVDRVNDLPLLLEESLLSIQGTPPTFCWEDNGGSTFMIFGYILGGSKDLKPISRDTSHAHRYSGLEDINVVRGIEGRFIWLRVDKTGDTELWTDRYGRMDVYLQENGGSIVVASGIDLVQRVKAEREFDFVGLAHSLTVYGGRPAKKHTLYKDIRRLGIDEGIKLRSGNLTLLKKEFSLVDISHTYGEDHLGKYSDHLIDAVRARSSPEGNVVYLSSGWDSTAILAVLVHLFTNRRTRAVIGRMIYSDRSGVINQFEVDRAIAFTDYFKVPLEIIDLDYRLGAEAILDRTRELFRSQGFSNLTGLNHWLLAEAVAVKQDCEEVIFAGEISDGSHNLGFSQFISIFHPKSQAFREYSDKMYCYLFGPSFLEQVIDGRFESDPVWQIIRQRSSHQIVDRPSSSERSIVTQLLSSFFLRASRLPFSSATNIRMLTARGRIQYCEESEAIYFESISKLVTPRNIYSCYLHLYNSFHWQGATVATLEHTADSHGLKCMLPFHDEALINFLAKMPESWGRGLDLNPTKYPLKWMLKHRIDYPIHLQTGPHSYIYDVDPNFSHLREILYHSSFKSVFQRSLSSSNFLGRLDSQLFDIDYIKKLVSSYISNEPLPDPTSQSMSDLGSLAVHSVVGTY